MTKCHIWFLIHDKTIALPKSSNTNTMDKQIENAINDLLNTEVWSSNLYLALQVYFEEQDMPILASWLKIQERKKSKKIHELRKLLLRDDGMLTLHEQTFEAPEWMSLTDALNTLLTHEQYMAAQTQSFLTLAENQEDPSLYKLALLWQEDDDGLSNIFAELAHLLNREWKRKRLPF